MASKRKVFAYLGAVLCFLSVIFVAATTPVFAKQTACGAASYYDPLICGYGEGANEVALQNRIRRVLETVYMWIGIIAVIVIVIGGIRYMTSTGEAEKIKGAKNTIMYAIIGLVVTLAAFAITEFILGALEGRAPEGGGTHAEEGGGGGGSGGETRDPVDRPDMEENWNVSVVSLSKRSLQLKIGASDKLSAKVYPENAVDKTLTWASSNEKVASVDQEGNVLAISGGTTKISATSRNNITDYANVTVFNPEKPVLSINKTTLFDEETTMAKVEKNKGSVKWSTSNASVLKVDNSGKVTAKSPGKATLKAVAKNDVGEEVELTKNITVKEMKILWVGNSKTYVAGGIDNSFKSIAKNRGYSLSSTRVVKAGSTLHENYVYRGTNIKKYYDVVIMQEQTDAAIDESRFYKGALEIAKEVKKKNSNVEIYVRKTWYLRDNKSSANKVATNVAKRVAKETGLKVYTINDGNTLYDAKDKGLSVFDDVRHQNSLGAFGAAACIAATVLKLDPTTITYKPSKLSSSSLTTIKSIAKSNCYN